MDRAQRWTLRLGAIALPLSFLWTTYDSFVLPKLLVARLLALVLAALLLLRWAKDGRVVWKRTPLDVPLILFLASAGVSTALAINRNLALFGTYTRYEGLLTLVTYAALFWLTVQTLNGLHDARALIRSLLVSAYVVSVVAVLQSVLLSLGGGAGAETAVTIGRLVRASATFGNSNALAIFLAMLLPCALDEVLSTTTRSGRLLAVNQLLVMGLALLLTFGRAAWIGAGLGTLVVLMVRRPSPRLRAVLIGGLAGVLIVVLAISVLPTAGGLPLGQATVARLMSIGDVGSGSLSTRLHVWRDTIPLIASRPLFGYGPDTFGLAFPLFASGQWTPGFLIDKTHAELLQAAATQGLFGLVADLFILFAFVRCFLTGRRAAGAGFFGGWIAYQAALQVNFSYLPAAAPFWIFTGAAVVVFRDPEPLHVTAGIRRRLALPIAAVMALLFAALTVPSVILPYAADHSFLLGENAVVNRQRDRAIDALEKARALAPQASVYAVARGDLALDLRGDEPGPDADWLAAREAYEAAAKLGTFDPAAFRHLALADQALGRSEAAIAAARRAVELDRFDARNQALLHDLTS